MRTAVTAIGPGLVGCWGVAKANGVGVGAEFAGYRAGAGLGARRVCVRACLRTCLRVVIVPAISCPPYPGGASGLAPSGPEFFFFGLLCRLSPFRVASVLSAGASGAPASGTGKKRGRLLGGAVVCPWLPGAVRPPARRSRSWSSPGCPWGRRAGGSGSSLGCPPAGLPAPLTRLD